MKKVSFSDSEVTYESSGAAVCLNWLGKDDSYDMW